MGKDIIIKTYPCFFLISHEKRYNNKNLSILPLISHEKRYNNKNKGSFEPLY